MINMNPKYHLLIAVAALSLGACSTDDTCTEPENEGYKISFTVAEDSDTRTTLETLDKSDILRWVSTDKVGIYTGENSDGNNVNSNISTAADVSKSPVEFVGTLKRTVSPCERFYAYYPYDEWQSPDPTNVSLRIPELQKQTQAGVYNGESHPLVAVPMELSQELGSDASISNVRFRQLGAIVELQLYSSNEALRSEKINLVTFESNTPLAGNFWFDLTTVTDKKELKISGYKSTMVETLLDEPAVIPATKDQAARIYLTIAPGQYTGNIYVKTDAARYTFRLNRVMTFERAVIMGLPADLAEAERDGHYEETDPIPFKDQTVKEICLANWDTDGDGELSYKEAAAVTSIGSQFKGKSIRSFKEFRYFTGLQSIGESAFSSCKSLTSITIPKSVTTIYPRAFVSCSSLTSIHIPEGVTWIRQSAFQGCRSLMYIHIPDGVTRIESDTFFACDNLTNIYIPETVTEIGDNAFGGCYSLKSITIPKGVKEIESYAFSSCRSLTSITIPEEVTAIRQGAFSGCEGLKSITIPKGVTEIESDAFKYCISLTSVYCTTVPPTLGAGAFSNTPSSMKIYVPTDLVERYKKTEGWSEYESQIFADNNNESY